MKINRIEHMCEGNGHVIIKELLDEQQLNGKWNTDLVFMALIIKD